MIFLHPCNLYSTVFKKHMKQFLPLLIPNQLWHRFSITKVKNSKFEAVLIPSVVVRVYEQNVSYRTHDLQHDFMTVSQRVKFESEGDLLVY